MEWFSELFECLNSFWWSTFWAEGLWTGQVLRLPENHQFSDSIQLLYFFTFMGTVKLKNLLWEFAIFETKYLPVHWIWEDFEEEALKEICPKVDLLHICIFTKILYCTITIRHIRSSGGSTLWLVKNSIMEKVADEEKFNDIVCFYFCERVQFNCFLEMIWVSLPWHLVTPNSC